MSTAPRTTERPRLRLSLTQVLASALAAVTATVAASYLGLAGTVVGAAVASVLTVTGNAVYGHSLQRFGLLPAVPATAGPAPVDRTARRPWAVFAAACVGVFAGVLVVVTAVELVAGRPLTDVVRGTSGSGTTVLGDTGRTAPPVTITVTPKVVTSTPTITVTGPAVTETTTPTTTTSGSGTASRTGTGTPAPSTPTSTSPSTSAATSASTATPTATPTGSATAPASVSTSAG